MTDRPDISVAMLTYSTRARGGVAHALKLSERLMDAGVDIVLYSLARDDELGQDAFYRETSVPTRISRYTWDEDVMTRLERMITAYVEGVRRDHDVYHAQDCVGGSALARMKDIGVIDAPVFRTVHHVDDFAEPRLFEFEKRAVGLADHRFVVSEYWRAALQRDFGLDSIVAYNGIDLSDFSDLPQRSSSAPTVLFVGGLEPRKGLELLMLAAPAILRAVPDTRFEVVAKTGFRGVDRVEWFETLAERVGVRGSVEFHDSISQEALLQLYSDADVVVLPSRNEGWGLSLMEAMACSKPVVATRVGGIPEMVRDGTDGLLAEREDVLGLGRHIVRILLDHALAARLGASGRQRVARYSWRDTAARTLEAYREALQQV